MLAGVVGPMQTGKWVTEGKGKNQTTTFVLTSSFVQGDGVVIQATVKDEGGAPVPDATVTIAVSGPESAELTTGPSDAEGVAEATWNTQSPSKKGQGGIRLGSDPDEHNIHDRSVVASSSGPYWAVLSKGALPFFHLDRTTTAGRTIHIRTQMSGDGRIETYSEGLLSELMWVPR